MAANLLSNHFIMLPLSLARSHRRTRFLTLVSNRLHGPWDGWFLGPVFHITVFCFPTFWSPLGRTEQIKTQMLWYRDVESTHSRTDTFTEDCHLYLSEVHPPLSYSFPLRFNCKSGQFQPLGLLALNEEPQIQWPLMSVLSVCWMDRSNLMSVSIMVDFSCQVDYLEGHSHGW